MSFQQIADFTEQTNIIKPEQYVILGLSGGPDSVYLFHFLLWLRKKIPFKFIAAHLDHEWRKESHKDIIFCEKLCKQHDITFVSKAISELDIKIKKTGSKEDQARKYRRFFFKQVQKQFKADSIALAHTQDDQLETFFIRLIRGATVTGLSCIRTKQNGLYIRPLLKTTKKTILAYLEQHKIKYLTDPTNVSPKFLRNRIRLELIPILQKIDSRAEQNILKSITALQETDRFLEKLSKQTLETISTIQNGECHLYIKEFLDIDPFLQKRVILEWLYKTNAQFNVSTGLIEEIIRFLKNKKSATHQIDTWQIKKLNDKVKVTN